MKAMIYTSKCIQNEYKSESERSQKGVETTDGKKRYMRNDVTASKALFENIGQQSSHQHGSPESDHQKAGNEFREPLDFERSGRFEHITGSGN